MVSATATTTPDGNFVAKTTLKSLQQDPVAQSELKSVMDSLGDTILLGLTEEEPDPAQPLFKPFASRSKRPLLIPDFISSLPLALHEVKETVLGTIPLFALYLINYIYERANIYIFICT